MDTRKLTTAQKSGASYDKAAATKTNNAATAAAASTTSTGGQVEGAIKTQPTFSQANTAMTTDGFKGEGVEEDILPQGDNGVPITSTADGTLTLGSDQQQLQKSDTFSDWNQVDDSVQKVQQGSNSGNKLRNMFGRLQKGSDGSTDQKVEGLGQGQGEVEESEGRQKTAADDVVKE
jgi:hypothetical protein